MALSCYEAIQIPIGEGFALKLSDDSPLPAAGEPVECNGLPDGWLACTSARELTASSPKDRPPFIYDASAPERGLNALRLFEQRDYWWQVISPDGSKQSEVGLTSSLKQAADGAELWRPKSGSGRFRFANYLGSAWIDADAPHAPRFRIAFDVASPKLDYEVEYRSMVESIGQECQQLLLDWATPTTLNISADPKKRTQTLLEQFLFLRHVLGPEKLDLYLEVLQRRPHSTLVKERNWKPASIAEPSAFVRDPVRLGRDWRRSAEGLMPGEICEERKFDSHDTPPNRFIKFALQSFRNVCDEVLNARLDGKPVWGTTDTVVLEAVSLQHSLDAFLMLPLFNDVGELRRIPFESTTLQRREGYREILLAWLMLDAAVQIDWPGREDAYDGTNRNVATLYEFWLFFLLVRAFKEDLGMVSEHDPLEAGADGALPFCCHAPDGRLLINLRQQEESFCRFAWKNGDRKLRVHFFYNRSFGRQKVGARGTYSMSFRPDYTLVIIPDEFDQTNWHDAEREAEKAGRIAYLHFDAKYRGENLAGLFGPDGDTDDGVERAAGSVKNVDLYKMHTYNDAIRRSIGSYVLYPGEARQPKDANRTFERYHELIPGIGAFGLRPMKDGEKPDGLPFVVQFISDILNHQLDRFTQSYQISAATERVVKEKPLVYTGQDAVKETVALPEAVAVLGYMRKEQMADFKEGNGISRPFFYCRATDEDKNPLELDISAAQGAVLIGWCGSRSGPFHTAGWMARIQSCRLVTGKTVEKETALKVSSADRLYLLFGIEDIAEMQTIDITNMVKAVNGSGEGRRFRTFQARLKDVFSLAGAD